MTYEQAYAEGFCKAAEVVGVDPAALVKRAQLIGKIVGMARGAGKALKGGAKRYGELLMGGNAEKLTGLHRGAAWDGVLARPLFGASHAPGTTAGVPFDAATARKVKLERILNPLKRRFNAIRGNKSFDKDVVNEARKALAVQAGTALAGTGAVAGGVAAMRDKEPPSVWERLAAKLNIGK